MTAFTLEVLDSAGDTLLSFNDNTIVSFKLVESLSGIRPDLESRGLDKNAFFLGQEEQLWSPFASAYKLVFCFIKTFLFYKVEP